MLNKNNGDEKLEKPKATIDHCPYVMKYYSMIIQVRKKYKLLEPLGVDFPELTAEWNMINLRGRHCATLFVS